MQKQINQNFFSRDICLESLYSMTSALSSLLKSKVYLLDNEGLAFSPENGETKPLIDDEDLSVLKAVNELVIPKDKMSAIYPVKYKDELIAVLYMKDFSNQANNKELISLIKSFIDAIVNRSYELSESINKILNLQDELTTLYRMTEKIVNSDEIDAIAEDIMKRTIERLNAEKVILFLRKEDDVLFLEKIIPADRTLSNIRVDFNDILYSIFDKKNPRIYNDVKSEIPANTLIHKLNVNKMLAVPLVTDGKIGLLCIFDKKNQDDFYEADREFVCSLVNPAVVAMENINYLKDKQKREEKAWREVSFRSTHIIGNLLFGMRGEVNWIDTILNKSPIDTGEIFGAVTSLRESLNEANSIIRNFRSYYRKDKEFYFSEENIATIINAAVTETQKAVGKDVRFVLEVADSLPSVSLDKLKIKQSITELIENACFYMRNNGVISIKVHIADKTEKNLFDFSDDGNYISILVEDTGMGITNDVKQKIFQPFFSTNANGSGLGLSIVKNYITKHGGRIKEVGIYDQGAKFIILLPY